MLFRSVGLLLFGVVRRVLRQALRPTLSASLAPARPSRLPKKPFLPRNHRPFFRLGPRSRAHLIKLEIRRLGKRVLNDTDGRKDRLCHFRGCREFLSACRENGGPSRALYRRLAHRRELLPIQQLGIEQRAKHNRRIFQRRGSRREHKLLLLRKQVLQRRTERLLLFALSVRNPQPLGGESHATR